MVLFAIGCVNVARVFGELKTASSSPTIKEQIVLHLDREVLDFFQADGPGWQERINQALRKVAGK